MPQRFLRPGITTSDHWNSCSFEAQSFYVRLLTLVDDFGRFDGRIPILHGQSFPLRSDITPQQTAALRSELHAKKLIDVYEVDGKEYVQVLRWQERARQNKSKYPDPVAIPLPAAADGSVPQEPAAGGIIPQEKDASLAIASAITSSPSPPPTVPQGGLSDLVSGFDEAKRIICADILKGKDPGRPWSYEATEELSRQLPIPVKEFKSLAWFHVIPDDKETPELRDRRRSETTLVKFWSDEVTRAEAYRKKIGASVNGSEGPRKKEPARWREFFRAEYGDAVVLPQSFWLLPADQRKEWESGHEAFEKGSK